jgi:creatinine amidohydrolase
MTDILDVSHTRARALLAGGAPVFLPVNPVEYHGPHLSLHNDALISAALSRAAHAELARAGHDWPLLLASDLEVGVGPTSGPGSRHVSYREVASLVVEACRRLAELGAQRVVVMTFHGNPLHNLAIDEGVRWLTRHGVLALSPFNVLMQTLVDLHVEQYADAYATVEDEAERAQMIREGASDFHAGFFETSLALHYAPESVDPMHVRLPPCPEVTPDARLLAASRTAARFGRTQLANELRFAAIGVGWHALRPFPGYTSRPHRASREAGAAIARHLVHGLGEATVRVLRGQEAPPAPIMPWVAAATLRGAIPTDAVPLEAVTRFEARAEAS